MPTSYPNKDELVAIKTALEENSVKDPRALKIAVDDFRAGEFSETGIDSYIVATLMPKLTEAPAATGGEDGLDKNIVPAVTTLPPNMKPSDNPFSDYYLKEHGKDKRDKEIGRLARVMGTTKLAQFAAAQGKTISGQPLRKPFSEIMKDRVAEATGR